MKAALCLCLLCLVARPAAAQGDEEGLRHLRESMVKEQIRDRNITDPRLLAAFQKVQRHLFVRPELRPQAYSDAKLPINETDSTPSPYIVAIMAMVLEPSHKTKILEVGTGSGYQTAIMAELSREVYSIEINARLSEESRRLLSRLGYRNIRQKTGNGYLGWPEYAPFDGIIVTCSPDKIPELLLEQLAAGGRMIIPLSYTPEVQELILIEKAVGGKLRTTHLLPVNFSPMIRAPQER